MNEILVDLGNSRLKYALVVDGHIERAWAVNHGDGDWRGILARGLAEVAPPARVRLASVAHEMVAQATLATLAETWPGVAIERITTESHGAALNTRYAEPARLGVDRFLTALVAARTGRDVLVVGCGTALTADFVDADGVHRGGWIAPGPETMRAAVLARTARVHWLRQGQVEDFATSTENALESGAWHATAGFTERALRVAQAQCSGTPTLWLHGGGADTLASLLTVPSEQQHDLVFRGMLALPDR